MNEESEEVREYIRECLKEGRKKLEGLYKEKTTIEQEMKRLQKWVDALQVVYEETQGHLPSETEAKKYAGMSITQASRDLLHEVGKPMHAKAIYQKIQERGIEIKAKKPISSVITSLRLSKGFKKVGPNTFWLREEEKQRAS